MIKMLPGMIYAWLVLWIIPFYPHYRKAFKAKWFQIASCALCAAVLVCVCVVVSWKKRNELILILPLLIVCSYVDIRDQEIPDLPLVIMFVHMGLSHQAPHTVSCLIMALIAAPFVFMKKIGAGDIKLMGLMIMKYGLIASAGFAVASLLCIIVQLIKKESLNQRIPFGPYLCIGFLFTLLSAG